MREEKKDIIAVVKDGGIVVEDLVSINPPMEESGLSGQHHTFR